MDAALLMLADSRFPAGGHAFSAGVEAAISLGDIVDAATLERYLSGRLATTGRVDAAFAANACARLASDSTDSISQVAQELDSEYSARTPSPYLRSISRRLGRQVLRPATRIWNSPGLSCVASIEGGPHQPVALGAIVTAAGGNPADAASVACHHLTAAVTSAGVRLLGLDPIELAAVQTRVGHLSDTYAARSSQWASMQPSELPACGGSLTEILGEHHGSLPARMFVA